jgi:hypothetical protein
VQRHFQIADHCKKHLQPRQSCQFAIHPALSVFLPHDYASTSRLCALVIRSSSVMMSLVLCHVSLCVFRDMWQALTRRGYPYRPASCDWPNQAASTRCAPQSNLAAGLFLSCRDVLLVVAVVAV